MVMICRYIHSGASWHCHTRSSQPTKQPVWSWHPAYQKLLASHRKIPYLNEKKIWWASLTFKHFSLGMASTEHSGKTTVRHKKFLKGRLRRHSLSKFVLLSARVKDWPQHKLDLYIISIHKRFCTLNGRDRSTVLHSEWQRPRKKMRHYWKTHFTRRIPM